MILPVKNLAKSPLSFQTSQTTSTAAAGGYALTTAGGYALTTAESLGSRELL